MNDFILKIILKFIPKRLARMKLNAEISAKETAIFKQAESNQRLRDEIITLKISKRSIHERLKLTDDDPGDNISYEDLKIDRLKLRQKLIDLDVHIGQITKQKRKQIAALRKAHWKKPVQEIPVASSYGVKGYPFDKKGNKK